MANKPKFKAIFRVVISVSHEVWKICFHNFFNVAAMFLILLDAKIVDWDVPSGFLPGNINLGGRNMTFCMPGLSGPVGIERDKELFYGRSSLFLIFAMSITYSFYEVFSLARRHNTSEC